MEVDELVRACLEELRDGDEFGAAREMAQVRRVELLGTPGVASGLVTCAVVALAGMRGSGVPGELAEGRGCKSPETKE